MKKYMAQCVIESPRRGSSARSEKVRSFGKIVQTEDGPDYEGLTRIPSRMGDDKDFSDKLGPLRKYLISSCGRPWNDVYSEIAINIGRKHSEGLRHIKEAHIDVATHTYRDSNGDIWECDKDGEHKIGRYAWRETFYVEPETGILRCIPVKSHRYRGKSEDPDVIPLDAGTEYRRINGIWYWQQFTEEVVKVFTGTVRGTKYYKDTIVIVVVKKRQLGKKELKRLAGML